MFLPQLTLVSIPENILYALYSVCVYIYSLYVILKKKVCFVLDKISLCISGWPGTYELPAATF